MSELLDESPDGDLVVTEAVVIEERRRCKSRTKHGLGRRCKFKTVSGQKYCLAHGGAKGTTLKTAVENLDKLLPVAVGIIEDILVPDPSVESCGLCGRGKIDQALQLKATQIVFDRTGLGPELKIQHSGHISVDQLVEKMTEDEFRAVDEVMTRVMARAKQELKAENGD